MFILCPLFFLCLNNSYSSSLLESDDHWCVSAYQCTYCYFVIPGSITNVDPVIVKAEPDPRIEHGGEIPYPEIGIIYLPGVNGEFLERSKRIIQTAGNADFCFFKVHNS